MVSLLHTCDDARRLVTRLRQSGKTVGLIPTMGALHAGHLSLVQAAQRECDVTLISIFVNPTQFGPREDLGRYPRQLEADCRMLSDQRADYVFAPAADEIYPPQFSTYVEPPQVAHLWEGECRPGHFRGVATVVLKLFQIIPAQQAYFGRKDLQQTLVVRQMVRDFNVPIVVRVCPTVREPDGLAMSSRNAYLNDEQRQRARAVSASLRLAQDLFRGGETSAPSLTAQMRSHLISAGIDRMDYVALVDPENLSPIETAQSDTVGIIAVWVGTTRLIDNMTLGGDPIDNVTY